MRGGLGSPGRQFPARSLPIGMLSSVGPSPDRAERLPFGRIGCPGLNRLLSVPHGSNCVASDRLRAWPESAAFRTNDVANSFSA